MNGSPVRRRLQVQGIVQGVGFRPYVHRLATELRLTGFVGNDAASVFIEVQGPPGRVARFEALLQVSGPPLALITGVQGSDLPVLERGPQASFEIVASRSAGGLRTLVPPDVATCDACLRELGDPGDRRYRHPFITCTDCGPRLTIITDLPYDRPATTMAGFAMCPDCAAEYRQPTDRRYHAQPVACHDCGPTLSFGTFGVSSASGVSGVSGAAEAPAASGRAASDAAIAAAQQALAAGQIVAIKGIGGFHLACRADDAAAVSRLRSRKARGGKPFALMVRTQQAAAELAQLSPAEVAVLSSPARPIVLLRALAPGLSAAVCAQVAPGSPHLGLMLPYTPLHHLLLDPQGWPDQAPPALVLTSANLTDEPLCFEDADAGPQGRLRALADAVLTHDRPIYVPCDDSVVRVVDGQVLPLRRARGYAPVPIPIPPSPAERVWPPVLAVGGELKNTFALIHGPQVFVSAHVGDMGSLTTLSAFERSVDQLSRMVTGVSLLDPPAGESADRAGPDPAGPELIVAADAHPGYLTTGWATRRAERGLGPDPVLVQHHHAHLVSLLAERQRLGEPCLGITFDGTGYGTDAGVWGGEFLLTGSDASTFARVAHLRPLPLIGGDAAVRNPCRMALAYLHDAGVDWAPDLPPVAECSDSERAVIQAQLDSGAGVPCTSAGRFFDAMSSLLGVRHRIGYEAQAAMELEALAADAQSLTRDAPAQPGRLEAFTLIDDGAGALVLDHRPVVRSVVAGLRAGVPAAYLALALHRVMATAVAEVAQRVADLTGVRTAGLTGGVFQNILLLQFCTELLQAAGLEVLTHRTVPPNDGGLALGQAVVAALQSQRPGTAGSGLPHGWRSRCA